MCSVTEVAPLEVADAGASATNEFVWTGPPEKTLGALELLSAHPGTIWSTEISDGRLRMTPKEPSDP